MFTIIIIMLKMIPSSDSASNDNHVYDIMTYYVHSGMYMS